jgi:hypothetical protein
MAAELFPLVGAGDDVRVADAFADQVLDFG